MKLAIDDLYAVLEPLKELYAVGLPAWYSLQLKRLIRAIASEMEVVEPERLKLMEKYKKGKTGNGNFLLPQPGDENFDEFRQGYAELFGERVDIPYEKIDLSFLETDTRFGDVIIKPKIFEIVDALNGAFDEEVAKKVDVVDVEAEVKKIEGKE